MLESGLATLIGQTCFKLSKGSEKRFLLYIVLSISVMSAFMDNTTTVVLLLGREIDNLAPLKKGEGTVIVIGGGMTGLETAERLAEDGNKVIVVEMMPIVGNGIFYYNVVKTQMFLTERGAEIKTSTALKEVKDHSIVVEPYHGKFISASLKGMRNINGFIDVKENENTEPYEIPVDATVLSLGIRPDLSMLDELDARFERVVNIGDWHQPRPHRRRYQLRLPRGQEPLSYISPFQCPPEAAPRPPEDNIIGQNKTQAHKCLRFAAPARHFYSISSSMSLNSGQSKNSESVMFSASQSFFSVNTRGFAVTPFTMSWIADAVVPAILQSLPTVIPRSMHSCRMRRENTVPVSTSPPPLRDIQDFSSL